MSSSNTLLTMRHSNDASNAPPQDPNPIILDFCLKEIQVSGLRKRPGNRLPDTFTVIFLDGKNIYTTNKRLKTTEPSWRESIDISARPSSILQIELFHASWLLNKLIGKFKARISDLIETNAAHTLIDRNAANTEARATVKLAVNMSGTLSEGLSQLRLENEGVSDTLGPLGSFDDPLANVSNVVDQGIAVTTQAQSAYAAAQIFGLSVEPIGQALQFLAQVVNIIDGLVEAHPIAQAAWIVLSSVYKAVQKQMREDENIQSLAESMCQTLAFARKCPDLLKIEGVIDIIREMSRAVLDAASLIEEYVRLPLLGRALRSTISTDLLNRRQKCQNRFLELNGLFDRTVLVETQLYVKDIQRYIITKQQIDLLDRLPRVKEAKFDPGIRCMGTTRKEIINAVIKWASDSTVQTRIFWLYGLAGFGKSTIATSVSCDLHNRGWLGASFFFSRDVASRSKGDHMFSTIAFQMSSVDPMLTKGICKAISEDLDVGHAAISYQFEKLIQEPLQQITGRQLPLVILIDALDECGTERERRDLLTIIRNGLADLHPSVKFVITSRPDGDLQAVFASMAESVCLYDLTSHREDFVTRDIREFIATRMADIARSHRLGSQGLDWPGQWRRDALVQRAAGLFRWASTACDFIEDDESDGPEVQLDLILEKVFSTSSVASPWTALDSLYFQVLEQAVTLKASVSRLAQIREILGAIVTVRDPLSAPSLGMLLNLQSSHIPPGEIILERLRKLHSVLVVPVAEDGLLRIIHPSFVDFVTDRSRCTNDRFYVDEELHHTHLAKRCLICMQKYLRRDICGVGLTPRINEDLPDLRERLTRCVPDGLRYACRFWAEHLARSNSDNEDLRSLISAVLSEHLLHWFEVLSLLGLFDGSLSSLRTAQDWVQRGSKHHYTEYPLTILLEDGCRFVRDFRIPIVASAVQTYISALAFSPQSSHLFRAFSDRSRSLARVLCGADDTWTGCIATMEGHLGAVSAMAFSPDGREVASGSADQTVRVWDRKTGAAVGVPMESHASIIALIFSSDGHIISGSVDGIVYVWNRATAAPTAQQKCDTGSMVSLALSRDETRVLCGSHDESIPVHTGEGTFFISSMRLSPDKSSFTSDDKDVLRLWAGQSQPWSYHGSPSISFSSNGDRAVIITLHNSLLVWETETGSALGPALLGHKANILAAVFSPDGAQVVSSSADKTIHIWDITSASPIMTLTLPFDGQTAAPNALALSSDGSRIAFTHGAFCQNVYVWDVGTSSPVDFPLEGHPVQVAAVIFSPDGSHLLSASHDHTLRIWESKVDTEPSGSFRSDKSALLEVFLSPNGRQFVSVMTNGDVHLCDSNTGAVIGQAKEGDRSFLLSSVIFSPDGSNIAIRSGVGALRVWNLTTHAIIESPPRQEAQYIHSVSFSPDGNQLAFSYMFGQAFLWDLRQDKTTRLWHEDALLSGSPKGSVIRFSPNGCLVVSGNSSGIIRIWDASTGVTVGPPLEGHTSTVYCVAFSPDGSQIVSGSHDKTVRVWQYKTATSVCLPLQGHTATIFWVSFSPDARFVISQSPHEQLVWDAITHLPLRASEIAPVDRRRDGDVSFLHLLNNGWVVDLCNKPIFWVPAQKRNTWSVRGTRLLLGGSRPTMVDLTDVPL